MFNLLTQLYLKTVILFINICIFNWQVGKYGVKCERIDYFAEFSHDKQGTDFFMLILSRQKASGSFRHYQMCSIR